MQLRGLWPVGSVLLGVLGFSQGCRTSGVPVRESTSVEPTAPAVATTEPRALPIVPLAGARVAAHAAASIADVQLPSGFRAELLESPVFGGQVYTVEGGRPDGPLVVLVHGLGESGARDFYPVLPTLGATCRVFLFDLPGFGRSTHGTELYSPERYAQFIRGVVRRRHGATFNLVGHSMGGAISLMYAARFPGDLQRLFLIDAAGFLHRKAYVNFAVSAGLEGALESLTGMSRNRLSSALEAPEHAFGFLPPSPNLERFLTNDWLRANVLVTPTRIAALATMLENFAPAIAEVVTPTWILWGRKDSIASVRIAKVLEKQLPLAHLQMLEASGHDPMSSEPAAVSRFLLEGLASRPAPAGRPVPTPWAGTVRPGRCEGESGVRFRGDYSEIEIFNCRDVQLDGVRSRAIRIRNSVVIVRDSQVESQGVALDVNYSRVEITASDFVGDVALSSNGGDLDLAGARLAGKRKSVEVTGPSRLVFSISRLDSPLSHRYVHDLVELGNGGEL